MKNYILTLLIICAIIQGFYITFLRTYYYDWAKETIMSKLTSYTNFYNRYLSDNIEMTKGLAGKIVDDFEHKNSFAIEVWDTNSNIVASSMPVMPKDNMANLDYEGALEGQLCVFTGENDNTGENMMSASSPIFYKDEIIGVIRYSSSLEKLDAFLAKKYLESFAVLLFLLSISFFMSMIFINTIIKSLKQMSKKAEKMARGDFDHKLEIESNDELSELSATLNYMADEIKESQKLKNEFISSITHDIKTPLTAIIGWSELLLMQDEIEKEDLDSQVETIQTETVRLRKLVDELLDFSKFEIDRISLNKSPQSLNEIVEECLSIFMPRIKKYEVRLKTDMTEKVSLDLDKNRIKQVLMNIIDNSLKYSPSGCDLNISIFKDGDRAGLSISDSGIGIAKDDLARVKDKFFTVDKSKGGNGLGLSISEKIMQLHGGSLDIRSELGSGTTIVLSF